MIFSRSPRLLQRRGRDPCARSKNERGRVSGPGVNLFRVQRCRALKRGLLLQITKTLPRRRTILQSRCRDLADFNEDRTFIRNSNPQRATAQFY